MQKNIKNFRIIFQIPLDKVPLLWYNNYRKEDKGMSKKPNKKPTTYEIIELIFMGLTALASVISAIKWW
jgi:hypothetical protein